ncbi:zinc carboxypeptidase, partial [bacterium]|nr:zinc carboxypeptidase [bacterium]
MIQSIFSTLFSKRSALASLAVAFSIMHSGLTSAASHHHSEEAKTHYIEIKSNDKHLRTLVQDMGFAIDEIRSDKFFVAGTEADIKKLKAIGAPVTAQEIPERWFQMDMGLNAQRYTSYEEAKAQLVALANDYPSLVTQTTLGNSIENRDMTMVRISGRSLAQAEAEQLPVVLFTGCHHAREHLSVEVPLRMASYLVKNYETNPQIKQLLDTREVYIAPVINPDGHIHDYSNGIRGSMWRKNRRRNNDGTYGVDLNRNYGYQWGTGGSSSTPSSDTYKGVAPFSEAETANLKFFVDSQPRMTMLLTFHTFSELIL